MVFGQMRKRSLLWQKTMLPSAETVVAAFHLWIYRREEGIKGTFCVDRHIVDLI